MSDKDDERRAAIARLDEAIRDTIPRLGEFTGLLTGWVLIANEQNLGNGSEALSIVRPDHQGISMTSGLLDWGADEWGTIRALMGPNLAGEDDE